jgi:predicted transcriptional regulator with HTH domain
MSIQQTRQGFTFQDYIAIEVFLRSYLKKTLRKYYIDYLYDEAKQLSHDIRYIVEENGTNVHRCIEVKTGQRFRTETELIGKALEEIYGYLMTNPGDTYQLFISKDFEGNILTCWEALKLLRDGLPLARLTANQRSRMDYLRGLPHMRDVAATDIQMKDFLSRIELANPSLDIEFSPSHTKGVEVVISGLIHEVGNTILGVQLDIPRNQLALPHQLTQELIYITSIYAGTNEDVLPFYRKAIARFFSFAEQNFQPDVPALQATQKEFEKQLKEYEGLQEVTGQNSISETAEIGVPSA